MIRRDFERRLRRAEIDTAVASWDDRQKAEYRVCLRAVVKLHGLIRERLQAMGFDPELAQTLQDLKAAAELAAIPDTPDLEAADRAILHAGRANRGDLVREFKAGVGRVAELYRSGEHQLDLANASPSELLAFVLPLRWKRMNCRRRPIRPALDHGEYGMSQNPPVCRSRA